MYTHVCVRDCICIFVCVCVSCDVKLTGEKVHLNDITQIATVITLSMCLDLLATSSFVYAPIFTMQLHKNEESKNISDAFIFNLLSRYESSYEKQSACKMLNAVFELAYDVN